MLRDSPVPAWEVSGLWSCWICTQRETGTPISVCEVTQATLLSLAPHAVDLSDQRKSVSHSPAKPLSLVLLVSDSPAPEMAGWICIKKKKKIFVEAPFNLFFFFVPTAEEDPLMWFQLWRCWSRTDAHPCCFSRYAVTMLLLREEWHLSHFNSWSCFGAELRLDWKESALSQVGLFVSLFICTATSVVCKLLWHWRPTEQEGESGCTAGLESAVGVGTGPGEQAHSDTHHAAGTLDSLSKAPSVWHFFSPYSCNLIGLDGCAQGLLWRSPPVAVVWPELTDFASYCWSLL